MIHLHPKHGVNPMLTNCYYCNEPNGIALLGQPKSVVKQSLEKAGAPVGPDGEAPRRGVVIDKEPCHQCKKHMETGVIFISVDEEKTTDKENPYRTGGWCVVTAAFVEREINPEVAKILLKSRVAFVPDSVWDEIGLPRGEVNAAGAEA